MPAEQIFQHWWTLDHWSIFWTALGAIGQIAGAGATLWAVRVALATLKREKENSRRALRLRQIELAPQLLVDSAVTAYDEYVDDDLNVHRSAEIGIAVSLVNAGSGPAYGIEIAALLDQGGHVSIEPARFHFLAPQDHYSVSMQWSAQEARVSGILSMKCKGTLGAVYSRQYQFHTNGLDDHNLSIVLLEEKDVVLYPHDI